MKQLPIVKEFTIPELGWTVVDRRRIEPSGLMVAQSLWAEHARGLMRRNSSLNEQMICGRSPVKIIRDQQRFSDARAARPLLNWKQFEQEGGTVSRAWDCDPRLPDLFLCVRETALVAGRKVWIGAIPISNIQVETDTRDGLEIHGLFLLGLPNGSGLTVSQTWHKVFQFILNQPLPLVDRRLLNILQYEVPSDTAMRETLNEDAEIKAFFGLMRLDFDQTNDQADFTKPIQFRRR